MYYGTDFKNLTPERLEKRIEQVEDELAFLEDKIDDLIQLDSLGEITDLYTYEVRHHELCKELALLTKIIIDRHSNKQPEYSLSDKDLLIELRKRVEQ